MAQPMTSGSAVQQRPALRERDYLLFVLGTAAGLIHIIPMLLRGASPGDYTGIPELLGGLLLVSLGVVLMLRRQGTNA